ncbi:MAG: PepSY domain-containing protein [Alphaproteobacteria bacterium]|nr:PepSY domain-containing protein [Alphaproteobacteria bacterium]
MDLRAFLAALALAAGLAGADPAHGDPRRDHARARAALEAGEIRPLAEIVAAIERRYAGRVIEAELERERGAWIYEIKLLGPAGAIARIRVDAASGEVAATRGRLETRAP